MKFAMTCVDVILAVFKMSIVIVILEFPVLKLLCSVLVIPGRH